ncbi:hypothetical protein [Marinobacterium jannaschii]|uniref:hypothetical protein n=1 Tax=Marinobacterium jannaschii TaxID=64970 RepID=UPI000684EF7F|nr:hypothetical protein [Marinobacterium jannaschii]
MNEPKKVAAGTSVRWSFDHVQASGSGQFSYALRGPGAIDIAATAADGVVSVDVAPGDTAGWAPGLYEWRLFLVVGVDREEIGSGSLEIEPDFAGLGAGHDPRSHDQRVLDSIKKVLEGRVLSDHERYAIDGRSLDRIPIMELERLKSLYQRRVRRASRSGSARLGVRRVLTRLPG